MSDFPLQQPVLDATPIAPGPRHQRPSLMTVVVCYWATYILLQLLASALSTPDHISLWYYPAALSVGLLMLYGPKVLPAVMLAPLPVDLVLRPMGMAPATILVVSALLAGGYALAVLAFRKAHLSLRLRRSQDVAGFILLVILGPLLASFPIYGWLRATSPLQPHALMEGVKNIVISHALGALTLGPAILLWLRPLLILGWRPLRSWAPAFRWQLFLVQALTLALGAFLVVRFSEPGTLHLKYFLFLPMTWIVAMGGLRSAALGFPVLGTALILLILQTHFPATTQLGIQAFLCVLFGSAMFLGAAMDAQRAALLVRDRRSRHLNQLMDVTSAIPWEMDLETGRCLYLGLAVESLLGYSQDVWRRIPFWGDVLHPDDQLTFLRFLLDISRTSGVHQLEFRLRTPEGGEHWVRAAGGMESLQGPGNGRVMGFLFDIHAHKHAEENALRTTLKEKDILLREIHHRVKNNLQVVSSLLRLQASTSDDPALQHALKEAQERIQAIALIHQKLKHAPDFSQVDLPGYVRTLAERLVRSYASVPALINLQVQVAEVDIGPDAPVPLGLILNELVANALQHAFQPGTGGDLTIEIEREPNGWISLRVADSGLGLPETVELEHGGLGFQLVKALTDQLGGVLKLERRMGASFLLTFPAARQP